MAFAVEDLTDRDWTVRGWEWPEVVALAVLLSVGAVWALAAFPSRVRRQRPASVGTRRADRDRHFQTELRSESVSRRPVSDDHRRTGPGRPRLREGEGGLPGSSTGV